MAVGAGASQARRKRRSANDTPAREPARPVVSRTMKVNLPMRSLHCYLINAMIKLDIIPEDYCQVFWLLDCVLYCQVLSYKSLSSFVELAFICFDENIRIYDPTITKKARREAYFKGAQCMQSIYVF